MKTLCEELGLLHFLIFQYFEVIETEIYKGTI